MSDVKAKMHQIWFRLVYSAPPDPLAGFKGPTSKEMEGRERRERDVAPKLPDQTRPMFRLAIHLENVFLPTWCVTHISASCRLSSKVSFRMTLSDLAKYSMTWSPDSWASCFVSLSSIISLSIPFPGQPRLVFSDTFYCCFQKPFFLRMCPIHDPMLVIPRIHTELARRAFSVAATSTWNSTHWRSTVRKHSHFQTPLENQSVQTHLVLLCCIIKCLYLRT